MKSNSQYESNYKMFCIDIQVEMHLRIFPFRLN